MSNRERVDAWDAYFSGKTKKAPRRRTRAPQNLAEAVEALDRNEDLAAESIRCQACDKPTTMGRKGNGRSVWKHSDGTTSTFCMKCSQMHHRARGRRAEAKARKKMIERARRAG